MSKSSLGQMAIMDCRKERREQTGNEQSLFDKSIHLRPINRGAPSCEHNFINKESIRIYQLLKGRGGH